MALFGHARYFYFFICDLHLNLKILGQLIVIFFAPDIYVLK